MGDLDSDALRSHPLIAILFVLYTFGVTIVLLNILIAIVSDSYQNSFVSSKMMLGKARVMFVSELLSLKTFHQMWMDGKTVTTRRNINYVFGIVAILHIWMITGTINEKLGQGPFCEENTLSPNRVKLEAILSFFFLFTMLLSMKKTIAYVLNEFNDTGGLKNPLELRSASRVQRTLVWFVKSVFSALSNSIDSLVDREDSQKELGGSSPAAQDHRADTAIQRAIEKTRKNLKSELKSMFDQLQLSLREMEDQNKQEFAHIEESISNAIASAIAQSQQHMVEAIQSQQSREGEDYSSVDSEDGPEDISETSLSLGDVARSDLS